MEELNHDLAQRSGLGDIYEGREKKKKKKTSGTSFFMHTHQVHTWILFQDHPALYLCFTSGCSA